MVTYTLDYLVKRDGIESVNMALVFPASDADLLSHTEELLKKGGFRLAVFSHITAYPSVILPIKKLAALCHKYNVPVLVDGAHALGQIKIDVKDLGVEYYVATGYKVRSFLLKKKLGC
jgi:isopenicillin-N epimerase